MMNFKSPTPASNLQGFEIIVTSVTANSTSKEVSQCIVSRVPIYDSHISLKQWLSPIESGCVSWR